MPEGPLQAKIGPCAVFRKLSVLVSQIGRRVGLNHE
jgi:hypothetical protein